MCGIAGYLDLRRATARAELESVALAMAERIRHRGPDSGGSWADEAAGVAFAHRRLAIIDLTAEGHQPMHSADGRYVITYNGEIYNFIELRAELEALGHSFRGHSDTEVALAAIVQWGLWDALQRFVGMFAFALWDRRERCLHLVRDRLGVKPLYYAEFNGLFLFGSELRALQTHPGFLGEIDRDALALYLKRNCVPSPYSIFREVKKLAPGFVLSLGANDAEPRLTAYWSLREQAEEGCRAPFSGDAGEARAELDRILSEAVRCRMIADVPLGVFLSGGIDSSTVTALMQAQSSQPVKTFSIGFAESEFNEAKEAAAVARHLGTDHHELYIDPAEAQAVAPRLGALFDEPFADASQLPTFLVSQMTRQHVTVALSGDGGDELFGGYTRYLWCLKLARLSGILPHGAAAMLARLLTAVPQRAWEPLSSLLRQRNPGDKLHKLASILDAHGPASIYQQLVTHWQDPEAVLLTGREAPNLIAQADGWPQLSGFEHQMMYLDAMTYLPDDILTKVDRASMAVSLEAREPLLDHRVTAFAWSLPIEMKLHHGQGKRLLRDVLYRYVPKPLIDRPKMGFGVPIHDWLRGPLKAWAEALLAPERLEREGFFRAEPIVRKWREHVSGRRDWHYQLWGILMFQSWLEAQRTEPVGRNPGISRQHSGDFQLAANPAAI